MKITVDHSIYKHVLIKKGQYALFLFIPVSTSLFIIIVLLYIYTSKIYVISIGKKNTVKNLHKFDEWF